MKPIHLILQDDMLRNRGLDAPDISVSIFDRHGDWRAQLVSLENDLRGRVRPLVIASIEACEHIRHHRDFLRHGVVANYENCRFSRSMSFFAPEDRLNDNYIIFPAGEIPRRINQVHAIFGEHLFLRPDDSRKPFAGFPVKTSDLAFEMSSLRQVERLRSDELCVIDCAQDINDTEYRSWLIAGRVATIAAYSHGTLQPDPQVPAAVRDLATRLAAQLEMHDDALVVDIATLKATGEPKVIEVNAPSTSGLYAGANIGEIVRSFEMILA